MRQPASEAEGVELSKQSLSVSVSQSDLISQAKYRERVCAVSYRYSISRDASDDLWVQVADMETKMDAVPKAHMQRLPSSGAMMSLR